MAASRAGDASQCENISSVGLTTCACPENTGFSSGPVTCIVPDTEPTTEKGVGRTPSEARRAFTSTSGTDAEILYSPWSGFKSRSPVTFIGTAP